MDAIPTKKSPNESSVDWATFNVDEYFVTDVYKSQGKSPSATIYYQRHAPRQSSVETSTADALLGATPILPGLKFKSSFCSMTLKIKLPFSLDVIKCGPTRTFTSS